MRAHVTSGIRSSMTFPVVSPEAGEADVCLEPLFVGVCGSDGNIYGGTHPYLRYPIVQGHEVVARVISQGREVRSDAVGCLVVVEPTVPCGRCSTCERGLANACTELEVLGVHRWGGLAQKMVAPAVNVHEFKGASPRAGVFVEPLAVALWALEKGRVTRDDRVCVVGGGSIGRAIVLAAKDLGVDVAVLDRSPRRREIARALGADSAWALADVPAQLDDWSATVAIDTTGAGELIEGCARGVLPGGRVVVVGISPDELSLPIAMLSRREVLITGSRNSVGMFPRAIEIATRHAAVLEKTVELEVPLERADDALRAVATKSVDGKVIVAVSGARSG